MKAVKRSIILCALSLALCVALLVGSTFAWFSDSITNSGNTITAGNLTAQWSYRPINDDTAAYEPVSEELALFSSDTVWQPGEPHGYDFKVENVGSVEFVWGLAIDLADTAGESQNNLTDVLCSLCRRRTKRSRVYRRCRSYQRHSCGNRRRNDCRNRRNFLRIFACVCYKRKCGQRLSEQFCIVQPYALGKAGERRLGRFADGRSRRLSVNNAA